MSHFACSLFMNNLHNMIALCITRLIIASQLTAKPYAGHYYYEVVPGACASPVRPCQKVAGSLVALVIRAVVYGIYIIWHFVLVWQGSSDMARMPMNTFRSVCCTLCFACTAAYLCLAVLSLQDLTSRCLTAVVIDASQTAWGFAASACCRRDHLQTL